MIEEPQAEFKDYKKLVEKRGEKKLILIDKKSGEPRAARVERWNLDTKYKSTIQIDANIMIDVMKIVRASKIEKEKWEESNPDKKFPKKLLTKQGIFEAGLKLFLSRWKSQNGSIPDLPSKQEQELEMMIWKSIHKHSKDHREKYNKYKKVE